jgi:pimeloyl-ACP methyl ester carboxylesterase
MIETPLLFGPAASLVGVLTQPGGAPAAVACIVPNSGLIHRIGPHRFAVKLARDLAGKGITTLRMDLAGVGDSKLAGATGDYRDQASRDLRAAMDLLEAEHGIHHFIVFGICSGAVNGFWTAVADPRVVGLLMYDGFWYRSRWTQVVRFWKRWRALTLAEIAESIRRNVRELKATRAADEAPIFASWDMGNPPRAEFVASMNKLADRQVSICVAYSGTVLEYYSYARQFRDSFPGERFVDDLRVEFHPDMDHMLTSQASQLKMIGICSSWATSAINRLAGSPA